MSYSEAELEELTGLIARDCDAVIEPDDAGLVAEVVLAAGYRRVPMLQLEKAMNEVRPKVDEALGDRAGYPDAPNRKGEAEITVTVTGPKSPQAAGFVPRGLLVEAWRAGRDGRPI